MGSGSGVSVGGDGVAVSVGSGVIVAVAVAVGVLVGMAVAVFVGGGVAVAVCVAGTVAVGGTAVFVIVTALIASAANTSTWAVAANVGIGSLRKTPEPLASAVTA